ncbi:collagenase-like [Drosophila innubila]|uniref:collagenase-like n=1 Tax=Drosophila innubila TaxID=198719 RepID=UPI00148BAB7E|nr:collagenase-like [Drosophila innubila]
MKLFQVILILTLSSVFALGSSVKEVVKGIQADNNQSRIPKNDHLFCGGSIIGETWILTAAHCTINAPKVLISYASLKHLQGTIIESIVIFNHPKYNEISYENDAALINTPRIQFTRLVNKIPLIDSQSTPYYKKMEWSAAIGWGSTNTNSSLSENLRYTYLRTINSKFCTEINAKLCANAIICASTLRGNSICHGDSGGPLVTSDKARLIGISSFGIGHCENRLPVGFTQIMHV